MFWGKEGETSVLFPGMKAGNVYVSADGSLKMKGLVVENSGNSISELLIFIFEIVTTAKNTTLSCPTPKEAPGL